MQTAYLAFLLALILALLHPRVSEPLRARLRAHRMLLWLAPPVLTALFVAAELLADAWSAPLTWVMAAYTTAPVLCAAFQGPGPSRWPGALDFTTILLLWLPLEFPSGVAPLIGKHAQGFLHSAAYGVAILLGLVVFAGFRAFPGMKCNPPRGARDWWLAAVGFALTAPLLILIGLWTGFIAPLHGATATPQRMALAAVIIFFATALPEEILFRSMVQNLLALRFGERAWTLAAASLIFGAAHLDNGPQPLPNWRYMILATIAGYGYGKVFQKGASVFASTAFHALVDWLKHFFF